MRIVAGPTYGRLYDVFLNGKRLNLVQEVRTLGIPTNGQRLGLVKVALVDNEGRLFVDPNGSDVATSWRFGLVRLVEKVIGGEK